MFDDVGPMTEYDVNEAIKAHEDEGWEVVSQKLASCYDSSSFQCFFTLLLQKDTESGKSDVVKE